MSAPFPARVARTLGAALVCISFLAAPAAAHLCWWYSSQVNRFTFSEPWEGGADGQFICGAVPDPGGTFDPNDQDTWTFLHYHCNWHDTHGTASSDAATGLQFLGFHRQLFLDFDLWRICGDTSPGEVSPCETIDGPVGERIEPYDPMPGNPIPGNEEDTVDGYDRGGDCAVGRPAAQDCVGCYELPAAFRGEALAAIPSLAELGHELDWSGAWGDDWHGRFHGDIGDNSPGCNDIGPPRTSPRDPAFWMAHKQLDEVARLWQSCQPTDFVIVIDRSGSMNDNCTTDPDGDSDPGQPDPGESPCKLNDARTAAKALADFIPNGGGHRIAVVTFGTDAGTNLGLTSVDGGGVGIIQTAIDNIDIDCFPLPSRCQTSIGDGIDKALEVLAGSPAEHKAILLLTDGMENEPMLIDEVSGDIPLEVQVCAIGYGVLFEDDEDDLRLLCEQHGGILIADDDLLEDGVGGVTLTKYFIDCFSELACEARIEDPVVQMPAGQVSSPAIPISLCGSEVTLSAIVGREWGGALAPCSLAIILETPTGALVDPTDPAVERGGKTGYDFARVTVPYHGELPGFWTAHIVRPQRTYTHGFTTDAYVDHEQGIRLVRREIHRLFPAGCNSALYYEDGSVTGRSAYRDALQRELAAGTINNVVVAASPADFQAKLMLNWDLIVFARQVDPTVKPYDAALQNKICQGQKALLTDFYAPAGAPNQILLCAGTIRGQRVNWNLLVGDGRLITGGISLANPGYPIYTFEVSAATAGGPWLIQARNELQSGSIVGFGSNCGPQWYAYSVLSRGLGRVTPYVVKPRVRLGDNILATFRLPTPHRPIGNWDAVTATVTLDRPGPGAPEVYTLFDNGTNGDRVIKNNLWSRRIPIPATSLGPHVLSARFSLTKGGCTVTREAEYSVMVNRDPNRCTGITWPRTQRVAKGGAVSPPLCFVNRCAEEDSFRVTVTANPPWLCLVQGGNRTPISQYTFVTPATPADEGACIQKNQPTFFVCVPPTAPKDDSTVVTYKIQSLGRPNERDSTVTVVVKSSGNTAPPPVAVREPPPGFWIRAIPNSVSHTVTFEMGFPTAGRASLKLYDLTGRLVTTVFDENMAAGIYGSGHESGHHHGGGGRGAVWHQKDSSGQRVRTGVYFYRLTLDRYVASGSVVVLW